ncbi:hypothetical protein Vretimale_9986 [Volvox reticuliferus]|uniref:C2 NT-type domain-containing protein n=1 Tax=Volvox reticuliferus TaxID=1737510 RepID=A0A8J4D1W0_9CHLO|nr:hypothetical protein Vretifemale_18861 [Volvox reticuliferus]GIM05540.1 hypothetical protein Vretimale_9986 [Volvox reticuliferus]
MFGKILRAGKGGHGVKYKIDLQVVQLENLPTSIRKCRVVWARSAKLQMTDIKDVRGSVASFKQTLTQVTTIYRDKAGKYEPKEYELKVQVPGKSSTDSPVTVGKSVLDMAKYCKDETTTQSAMVPIAFKIGTSTTGYLRLLITTIFLGDSNEDGGTEVSGLTGLTSDHGSMREQDLEGFGDEEHAKFTKKARTSKREEASTSATGSSGRGSSNKRAEGPRGHKPLPPTAEEEDSDLEDKPEAEPALTTVKSGRRKPSAARSPEIEEAEEASDNPFAKKKPTVQKVPAKVWEDDEDVSPLNSDVSDSEPPKPATRSKKVEGPDQSLDDMKTSLFSTKKTAGSTVKGVAGASAVAAAPSSKGSSSKANKIPTPSPPPPVENEDDESLRDDLFSAKPKGGLATASTKRKGAVAKPSAAAAAAGAGKQQKSKATLPSPPEDDDEEDEDLHSSNTAAQYTGATQKPRSKAVESSDAPVAKGSSLLTRAGSKQDSSKGGSDAELEQLRKQVSQLEKQLLDEQVAKDDLNKKMQKYADKIADLEDQLAEMEDEVAGPGRQSKEKVADLEARVSRLEREKATLEEQLEEEWATRKELEKNLKNKLDRAGDDEAAQTVAAFEVKYNRLKERYKMLEDSSQEELDELQDQLTEALSQVGDLQRQVKQLQTQVAQTRSAGAAGGAANVEELRNLRSENERLVQQLVSKTMELAELSESEITIKRELARLQEVNRKLAQKATTLEAQAAVAQAGKPAKGKK